MIKVHDANRVSDEFFYWVRGCQDDIKAKKFFEGERRQQSQQTIICLTFENTPLSADAVEAVLIRRKKDQLIYEP